MVAPSHDDELTGNPITFMTAKEIRDYYYKSTFELSAHLAIKDELTKPEYEFRMQSDRVLMTGFQVHEVAELIGIANWDKHTDLLHDYFRNPDILQSYFICKNRAFLKLTEILEQFPFDTRCKGEFRTFHLCEGPGYFIDAVHYARIKSGISRNGTWEWAANTLNPYFENIGCFDKLVDDSHIREHMEKWHFGEDGDGDIRNLNEDYLIKNHLAGTFDLVTADGSTNTQGRESELESIVAPLIEAEIKTAIMLLRTGGRLILKVYRLCNKNTRDMIELLAENFDMIRAFKPMASRPGSSEKYLICDGFGGKCDVKKTMMVDCDQKFMEQKVERMDYHMRSAMDGKLPYTYEQKRDFLKSMRPRMCNSLSGRVIDHLGRMFPRNPEASPWMKLYGNNLVRRLSPENVNNAIENYLLNGDVRDPESVPLNVEWICNEIMRTNKTFITSHTPLKTIDSLFIDPLALRALQTNHPERFFDLFENNSIVAPDNHHQWREHYKMMLSGNERHVSLVLHPVVTVESLLLALVEGFDHDMDSFTFLLMDDKPQKLPLFLSRFSSSIYVLMMTLFEKCLVDGPNIRFHKARQHPTARTLICHLLSSAGRLPIGIGLRSFVPLTVFDLFHRRICYQNLTMLSTMNR